MLCKYCQKPAGFFSLAHSQCKEFAKKTISDIEGYYRDNFYNIDPKIVEDYQNTLCQANLTELEKRKLGKQLEGICANEFCKIIELVNPTNFCEIAEKTRAYRTTLDSVLSLKLLNSYPKDLEKFKGEIVASKCSIKGLMNGFFVRNYYRRTFSYFPEFVVTEHAVGVAESGGLTPENFDSLRKKIIDISNFFQFPVSDGRCLKYCESLIKTSGGITTQNFDYLKNKIIEVANDFKCSVPNEICLTFFKFLKGKVEKITPENFDALKNEFIDIVNGFKTYVPKEFCSKFIEFLLVKESGIQGDCTLTDNIKDIVVQFKLEHEEAEKMFSELLGSGRCLLDNSGKLTRQKENLYNYLSSTYNLNIARDLMLRGSILRRLSEIEEYYRNNFYNIDPKIVEDYQNFLCQTNLTYEDKSNLGKKLELICSDKFHEITELIGSLDFSEIAEKTRAYITTLNSVLSLKLPNSCPENLKEYQEKAQIYKSSIKGRVHRVTGLFSEDCYYRNLCYFPALVVTTRAIEKVESDGITLENFDSLRKKVIDIVNTFQFSVSDEQCFKYCVFLINASDGITAQNFDYLKNKIIEVASDFKHSVPNEVCLAFFQFLTRNEDEITLENFDSLKNKIINVANDFKCSVPDEVCLSFFQLLMRNKEEITPENFDALKNEFIDIVNSFKTCVPRGFCSKFIEFLLVKGSGIQENCTLTDSIKDIVVQFKLEHAEAEKMFSELLGSGRCLLDDSGKLTRQKENLYNYLSSTYNLDINRDLMRRGSILRFLSEGHVPKFGGRLNYPVFLQKKEYVVYSYNADKASAYQEKTRRKYVAGSKGIGIHVAKGVTYRMGKVKGRAVSEKYYAHLGRGGLAITNLGIVWVSSEGASFRIPYKKILSVTPYSDEIKIVTDGVRGNKYRIELPTPEFAYTLISAINMILNQA